jgi:hypothetical protein
MRYHCMEMRVRHTNTTVTNTGAHVGCEDQGSLLSPENKTCIRTSYNRKCVRNEQFVLQRTDQKPLTN